MIVEIKQFFSSSLGHTWGKVQLPGSLHGGLRMSTIDELSIASGAEKLEKKPQKPPTFARWRVANGGADVDVLLHWHADLPQLPNNQDG